MRNNRRMRRMGRNKKKVPTLPLTSLMDVFTILVFFLLFHSAGGEAIEAPKQIKLRVRGGGQTPGDRGHPGESRGRGGSGRCRDPNG